MTHESIWGSIDERARTDVDRGRGHRPGVVGGDEGGDPADVGEGRGAAEQRRLRGAVGDRLLALAEAVGDRFGHAGGAERDRAEAGAAELGRELAAHRLDRVQARLESAEVEAAGRVALAAEEQDPAAGALLDHAPGAGAGGD